MHCFKRTIVCRVDLLIHSFVRFFFFLLNVHIISMTRISKGG